MKTQPEPNPPGENVPPLLGGFLSERRDHITKYWIDSVRRNTTLEAAKQVADVELADHLPKLFDDLAATLQGEPVAEETKEDAAAHGAHRWRQHYELEEVLEELGIVCRILLAHGLDAFVDEYPDTPKEQQRGARERILRFFEDTAAGSVRQYVNNSKRQMGNLHEKMRETDLSLSEQRRLALDSAKMGWWNYDVASGVVSCDERFRVLYDVDKEADVYALFFSRVHPEDQQLVDEGVKAALCVQDPVPYALDYRVRHRNGMVRWVASRGQAVFVDEGTERKAVRLAGTLTDITEEKTLRDTLQESEARFRQLADAMPQIVWTGTPDGFIDYHNQGWYNYTGTSRDRFGDTPWSEVMHPNDLAEFQEQWPQWLAGGVAWEREFRFRCVPDGAYRSFLGRGVPIKDEKGKVLRWAGTSTDIHDHKELQGQNKALLDSERAARTEAERISRVKDEFLATLSHELRTPLNAILGWTQVLRGDPANTEDMEAGLATIERNSRAQTQIIEDLLDMSKIISGKVRLDVQTLHLDQVVAAAVDTMRPAAAVKHIRLQTLIDPEARMISGDPNRLQQVFWNLLSNAIKFTPKQGQVQVVLQRVHSHLEVNVADTGEGIAPEFLPHVFDRFRQQDASTTRRHGGLGLGLAIVKQLVELHGGSIHVDSPGREQGTTFRVMLPLSVVLPVFAPDDSEQQRHPQSDGLALPIPADRLNLAGVKVLVVDDEADARELVRRLLEDRGATVQLAGSVAEAVETLSSQRPDVLVSDIGMPGEDGYALIRQVRALPTAEGGQTPAVALTAYARSEDRLKVILAGFQMHMAKPVEAAELLALVASLAGRVAGIERS